MRLSPDAVRTLLTSVFPSEFIDDRARDNINFVLSGESIF